MRKGKNIMKKTYINPITAVINVQTQQLMTGSESALIGQGQKDGGNAASRRGVSVWDDEEEE